MREVFFEATRNAIGKIEDVLQVALPASIALWNMRCSVNGTISQFCDITASQLHKKFGEGSGVDGVDYRRAFVKSDWERQKADFAWILLNNLIPTFESWTEELKGVFSTLSVKNLQYPTKIRSEICRITANKSVVVENTFYSRLASLRQKKRDRCFDKIENLLYCFRFFKEMRNCYMHTGCIASQKLLDTYSDFRCFVRVPTDIEMKEIPVHIPPILGSKIAPELRGVIGFSYVLIKIILTCDHELLCAEEAEVNFIKRIKKDNPNPISLSLDDNLAQKKALGLVERCIGIRASNGGEMLTLLLLHGIVKR